MWNSFSLNLFALPLQTAVCPYKLDRILLSQVDCHRWKNLLPPPFPWVWKLMIHGVFLQVDSGLQFSNTPQIYISLKISVSHILQHAEAMYNIAQAIIIAWETFSGIWRRLESWNIQGFSWSSDLLLRRLFHAATKPKGMITVLSIDSDAILWFRMMYYIW